MFLGHLYIWTHYREPVIGMPQNKMSAPKLLGDVVQSVKALRPICYTDPFPVYNVTKMF